ELFAELYAQAFAEVQGKTNGDKMGGGGEEEGFWELSNNAKVAILKGSLKKNNKMNPTYKAILQVLPALPGIQAMKVWVLPIGPMGPPPRQQLMQRLQGGARTQARRLQVTAISA
ncbi:hypothetical protein QJQ45_016989, partial [Haematococcus lacustris]